MRNGRDGNVGEVLLCVCESGMDFWHFAMVGSMMFMSRSIV